MYASTHMNLSTAAEQLTTQMQRAQELQRGFHTRSEQFRQWMSNYHRQMQGYFTKKIDYHERMEQLYRDQLLDDAIPPTVITAVAVAPSPPPEGPLPGVIDDADTDVTDMQWLLIAPLLPLGKGRGRPYVDDRRTLNGILYITTHHLGWSHMPPCYGSYVTCWRRYLRWQSRGVWSAVQEVLQKPAADEQHNTPVYGAARSDRMAYSYSGTAN